MNELMLDKEFAECYEVKDLKDDNKNCLRVYCHRWPDAFTFQIRTFKPITDRLRRNGGKKRNMIAHIDLSKEEVIKILEFMEKESRSLS